MLTTDVWERVDRVEEAELVLERDIRFPVKSREYEENCESNSFAQTMLARLHTTLPEPACENNYNYIITNHKYYKYLCTDATTKPRPLP
jgi:hypothetical protein